MFRYTIAGSEISICKKKLDLLLLSYLVTTEEAEPDDATGSSDRLRQGRSPVQPQHGRESPWTSSYPPPSTLPLLCLLGFWRDSIRMRIGRTLDVVRSDCKRRRMMYPTPTISGRSDLGPEFSGSSRRLAMLSTGSTAAS